MHQLIYNQCIEECY